MLANALSDAVVHTLTSGRWIFEFNIVVAASGPNHSKPAASQLHCLGLHSVYPLHQAHCEGSAVKGHRQDGAILMH